VLGDLVVESLRHPGEEGIHAVADRFEETGILFGEAHVPLHFFEEGFGLSRHPSSLVIKLSAEFHRKATIIALDRLPLIRIFRFPPTFRQNLFVLIASLAGIIALAVGEGFQHGLTRNFEITMVLLAALSAATGTLIYQERQSWRLLQELREALGKIAPGYSQLVQIGPPSSSTGALENEIRSLTRNWQEFCDHCQRGHDAEMVQAEHLATLGELASGIAHEIRNPLAGIAGAIEIITRDFPKDHPDREILEDLREEVRRIEKVLNELLTYARPKPSKFAVTDLKETIAHTLQFARQQLGSKNIEFSIQIPPSLPRFRMDGDQLHQVLLNLMLNGIQAIEEDGRIAVEARVLAGSGAPNQADKIEISVSDNGPGISPDHMEKIFRPFYTTKRSGTGLGLSLCRRIIRQHGGSLTAESQIKKGSRFIITLPMRESIEESHPATVGG
jgi:signal transduction histidine kinase